MNKIIKSILISMLSVAILAACGGATDEDQNAATATSGGGSEGGRSSSSSGGSSSPLPSGSASASVFWSIPTTRESGNALSLSELAGYIVFIGTQPGSYQTSVIVRNATQNTYTFSGLLQGNYYLAVRAFDTAGQISLASEVLKQAR